MMTERLIPDGFLTVWPSVNFMKDALSVLLAKYAQHLLLVLVSPFGIMVEVVEVNECCLVTFAFLRI